jgi:hypothetical protein
MAANPQLPEQQQKKVRYRRVPATRCSGCGEIRLLKGPIYSKRLHEDFWKLVCDARRPDHVSFTHDQPEPFVNRGGLTLVPMPDELREKLHRRGRGPVLAPRCNVGGCPGRGDAMNPQRKPHALSSGDRVWLLHCHCRKSTPAQPPHNVFLVLPGGEVATKTHWAEYEWLDQRTGQVLRTVSKVKPPIRRQPTRSEILAEGRRLVRIEGKTWRQAAEIVIPEEYKENPKKAMERLRRGSSYTPRKK